MARDVNQQTDDMLSPDDMMMADVNEPTTKEQLVDAAKTVGEVALDMTPIVGDIKAATELPEDIQLIKDLISEGYDEGDIKKMGLGGLFGIATGLGFIPLLGAPADATRIAIKAGVKKARPPKNKPPVPEFRQKQIDEVKKKYATSAERRKALKAINRPTPKVFHGASGLGEELNTDQIRGLAKDIAYQKKLYTQEPVERMFDGKDALSVDDFVKAIEQPDPSGLPFSVVMADKVSVGSVQPFAAQPKIFRVDPDDGTDGPRFIFMNLKHRDPFDDTLIGESNFAVPIVQGKVLKADLDYVTNRHTEDAYNDIVGTITGDSRAAKLQKEGFAPYQDFTGAKGLTSKSATGEHFELKEQALSTSRDPLVSMKPGFGNRTLQNVVEADLPPEAVADMSRKQYSDIERTGKLTETMGLDDTTIGASLPKTTHTESEIAVTRPELLNVRRLAEGKPELIRDVEPLTTKKDIPVAKNEKSRTVESTMASRPFQQGPMPEALGQKNVTERVARGQRLVNSIQKRITDLDTSAVDTALKGRPERTINSFYNKTKSLFNELQALGMFTEQYGARGTFDNILEQDILTGDFIGRLGKIARASSKMAEKTGQFGQKEKNLNIMFDTLDALNKNLPNSPTRAAKFKEKNSLRGISDAELSSFLFDENPSTKTIRKMYEAGLTRSSMFGDVSFGKEVGYDDYKRIIFMMTDKFNEGGLVMAEGGAVPMKEQMELFEEGGMLDQGGTTDPVSGNDVPTGSLQKEVRDDIPAQLSEGEFVMPADVVRYHGLDKMMALRDEAKAGLQRMEDMGQMGNSEEATIPDGIPFNMDDLELDDDPLEMQVGGFVPQIPQFTPGGVQQSQFAGYQPRYTPAPPMPTFDYASYMPAQQQFTPTQTFDTVPTFESYMPRMVTYVDDSGNEMQIPVDQNGNPTIPVPPGFRPKTEDDDATQQQPDTTPPPVTQPTQQQQEEDPSDGREFGGGPAGLTMKDSKIAVLTQLDNVLPPEQRTGFGQKVAGIKDKYKAPEGLAAFNMIGGIGRAFKESSELSKAVKDFDYDAAAANAGLTREEFDSVVNELTGEVYSGYRDPRTGEVSGQKDLRSIGERIGGMFKDEEYRDEYEELDPRDVAVKTAQVTTEPTTTVTRAAKPIYKGQFFDELTQELLPPFSLNQALDVLETGSAEQMRNAIIAGEAGPVKALQDLEAIASFEYGNYSENDANVAQQALDYFRNEENRVPASEIGQEKRSLAEEAKRLGFGGAKSTMSTSELRDIVDRQRESNRKEAASLGISEEAYLDPDKRQAAISEKAQREAEERAAKAKAARDAEIRRQDEIRRRAEDSERAKAASGAKRENKFGFQDNRVRDDQGTAKSVDDDGRIYYDSSHDWSQKTQTKVKEDKDPEPSGGGGCCFIMLEARYGDGTMDDVVRRYRDEHMTDLNKRGYYKLAEVFVPLMRKYPAFKWLVTKTFADPLVSYGKYYYGQNKHGVIYSPIKSFWMKVFDVLGTKTEFVRENGEVV